MSSRGLFVGELLVGGKLAPNDRRFYLHLLQAAQLVGVHLERCASSAVQRQLGFGDHLERHM